MNDSTNESKPMTRKSSSFYDFDELRREAEELRDAKNAENELKKNLMFEEKEISIFRIYCHLTEKIDIFFLALAIIGSLGSGLSLPIMAYISSALMGDVGNTSEYRRLTSQTIRVRTGSWNKTRRVRTLQSPRHCRKHDFPESVARSSSSSHLRMRLSS